MLNQGGGSRQRPPYFFLLFLGGLTVNILGSKLALGLGLPLFLDNIGSALAAALGGYIPGIAVGLFTNLINAIGDPITIYYGVLNVMIATSSAYFARHGYYEKPAKLPYVIATFALIGGGLGSLLSWVLYGFTFGEGISGPLARQIYAGGALDVFMSQFTADLLIDLADKTVTVVVMTLALRLLPKGFKALFTSFGWQQRPLSKPDMGEADHQCARQFSLRLKIIVLVSVASLAVATAVTAISFIHFRNASINEQTDHAMGVVKVMLDHIDGDRIDAYLAEGEAAEGYRETKALLQSLMDSEDSVQFCYVYRIEPDGCHVVFDPDTPDVPGEAPGAVIEFDDAFKDMLPALLAGERIEPVTSNETYGWLLSIYEPVFDSQGACQCYACVDVSMDHIAMSGYQFLARVVSLFLSFFIMIIAIAIWLAEYNIILPINSMALTAASFAFDDDKKRGEALERIQQLDIRTGDEIENLYHAVARTTEDMVKSIEETERQGEVISKLQNGLILVLADMVESRDQCTGDHVRKTAAYTRVIMEQMKKDGIYADQLTDAFMRDVENSAPLHDVGKIQVPDAILNKPGKLTDEEFEQMKRHTTAGSEVIERAMNMVSEDDSGYLKEADNLAHFHHEKWNGRGYPCGLKGEEIPLSARIMAVADVFDALVSRRPYKEGFSYEKAMSIIREGAGSHFDPEVAAAFERAGDEVRRIMNMDMEG